MNRDVRITDLDEPIRAFVEAALARGGIVLVGEDGTSQGSVVPWSSPSVEQRDAASERIRAIAQRTRERMEADGRTEEELDRILQED